MDNVLILIVSIVQVRAIIKGELYEKHDKSGSGRIQTGCAQVQASKNCNSILPTVAER